MGEPSTASLAEPSQGRLPTPPSKPGTAGSAKPGSASTSARASAAPGSPRPGSAGIPKPGSAGPIAGAEPSSTSLSTSHQASYNDPNGISNSGSFTARDVPPTLSGNSPTTDDDARPSTGGTSASASTTLDPVLLTKQQLAAAAVAAAVAAAAAAAEALAELAAESVDGSETSSSTAPRTLDSGQASTSAIKNEAQELQRSLIQLIEEQKARDAAAEAARAPVGLNSSSRLISLSGEAPGHDSGPAYQRPTVVLPKAPMQGW